MELEWSDLMCFGWAVVFLIWGVRFRDPDNSFVARITQEKAADREKLARGWSRLCFIDALCLVVVGIAAILDWTAVMLTVFFGMVAFYLFLVVRAWWKDT